MKIALVNQKGGCGKTSTTAILAKALADQGKKVLLIDADPQGGLTSVFIEAETKSGPGLYDAIIGHEVTPVKTNTENINIIPADYRLDKVFLSVNHFALESKLKTVVKKYDYAIFDTPPTVQGISLAVMMICNKIIIPTDISIQSKGPTKYTIEMIKEIKKKPALVLIGYDEKARGFNGQLNLDFITEFNGLIKSKIPKNTTAAKLAGQQVKTTKAIKEKLFNEILKAIS